MKFHFLLLVAVIAQLSFSNAMIWNFYRDSSCSEYGVAGAQLYSSPLFSEMSSCSVFAINYQAVRPISCSGDHADYWVYPHGCSGSRVYESHKLDHCVHISSKLAGTDYQWAKVTCGLPSEMWKNQSFPKNGDVFPDPPNDPSQEDQHLVLASQCGGSSDGDSVPSSSSTPDNTAAVGAGAGVGCFVAGVAAVLIYQHYMKNNAPLATKAEEESPMTTNGVSQTNTAL